MNLIRGFKKSAMNFLFVVFLVYFGFIAVMYLMQRSMIYYPDTNRPADVDGVERAKVHTSDGLTLEGFYLPPVETGGRIVVFFHGNAGHYGHRLYKAALLNSAGYGVLLVGYRGYGGNPGSPHEEGFYRDGRAFMDWVQKEKAVSSDRLVLYGESIGSGAATQMAVEYDISGLVIEASFASLLDMAGRHYPFLPVRLLLKDRFLNDQKIGKINAPLLIVYTENDRVVPSASTRKLFDAAIEPKEIVDIPQAHHNNLYEHGAAEYVLNFISGLGAYNQDNK